MADSPAQSPPTVVLLGASNLTRGISTVVETLQLTHDQPVRIVAGLGFGRSYGTPSTVMGRSLCSLLECGLWNAIGTEFRFALLTDIGNDVMYGVPPQTIAAWVEECVNRLASAGAQRINVTALPLDSIRRVSRWQFALVRSLLFPTRDITYETAISRAFETQYLVEELARRHDQRVRIVHHEGAWYGFDPIHIKIAHWPIAWSRFLAREEAHEAVRARGSLGRWRRLRLHMPERYALLGRQFTRAQPLHLELGSTIEMY
jgi:hypothetical protein